jgi:hypothetical protein
MTYRTDPLAFVSGAAQLGRSPHIPAHLRDEYALVPLSMLGQDASIPGATMVPIAPTSLSTGMSPSVKKIIAIIAVIVIVLAIAEVIRRAMAAKRPEPMTRNQAVRRLSTPQLAKTLYDRLEKRGNAKPETMRSLHAYARKA